MGVGTRVVYGGLAQRLAIPEADRLVRLPSGSQSVLQNRVGWAQDALKRAGLSTAPVRGTWQITDEGRKFLDRNGGRVPEEEMIRMRWDRWLDGESPKPAGELLGEHGIG